MRAITKTQTRRKKRLRTGNSSRNLKITETDLDLFRILEKRRFATYDDVVALLDRNPANLKSRLKDLFELGYIDLPTRQWSKTVPGSAPNVAALGNKGEDELRRLRDPSYVPKRKQSGGRTVNWTDKNRDFTNDNLLHDLGVSQFMTDVELGCRARGDVISRDRRDMLSGRLPNPNEKKQRNPMKVLVETKYKGHTLNFNVIPDELLVLEDGTGTAEPFVVEYDRGFLTVQPDSLDSFMKYKSYQRKLFGYFELWKQWSRWENANDVERGHLRQPAFGFVDFRVLTITKSRERIDNMIAAANHATNGAGLGLFLFAEEDQIFAYRKRVADLARRWRERTTKELRALGLTPNNGEWRERKAMYRREVEAQRSEMLSHPWTNGRGESVTLLGQ